ncbi:MAG: diaminopimelate decarboxylase [Deferribacterales bacterium]
MSSFAYENGSMSCEKVSLSQIASEVGTPFYVYSTRSFTEQFRAFDDAFEGSDRLVCFAVKSCSNIGILSLLGSLGAGADIVSGGELFRALKAGISPKKIVYAGVGKTEEEIEYALRSGILMFNAESEQELELLNKTALRLGVKAPVAIRVNPNVDPKTHPYISTGLKKNKFGISVETVKNEYKRAGELKGLDIIGAHCHIGSQLTDVKPFEDAAAIMANLITELKKDGINIKYLDMGGGLGISYDGGIAPSHKEYADAVQRGLGGLNVTLIFEPGRNISGNSGALVTKVLYTKQTETKHFKVVDAAMNDLARPSLYDAYHAILPVEETQDTVRADVVGPICETGDFLARDRDVADVRTGGLYAVMSAGAYGMSMASNYNSRPRVPEVLVDNENYYIIRRRETYEDLTGFEAVPAFLKNR